VLSVQTTQTFLENRGAADQGFRWNAKVSLLCSTTLGSSQKGSVCHAVTIAVTKPAIASRRRPAGQGPKFKTISAGCRELAILPGFASRGSPVRGFQGWRPWFAIAKQEMQ
jgi:hypothetical protein